MSATKVDIREMSTMDLEQVAALDASVTGLTRSDFLKRRWQAMENKPDGYIALVAVRQDDICGFVLSHIITGEFGVRRKLATIDNIAVTPEFHGTGVGAELMNALKDRARDLGCAEVRTLAAWNRQDMLGFFAKCGFSPLPVNVLEKPLPVA
ncbi:MAG: GNAT family N-acetyltransferase [Gammaproteobacteria bacterium]|nr:GNAT family N-acetyltransferase [Gammaproteobacteria bacterium]